MARTRAELLEVNRRTERLINGLLILASAEHGLDEVEPVALDRVVEQAVAEASPNDVTVSIRADPVTVRGDAVLVHRLVANLLDNALGYHRPNGTVHIELTRIEPARSTVLTVRNTGPVVPAERLAELFRPFSRLPHSRDRRRDGAGLGLSIVAAIAQAHHAELAAVPNPDGGLTVTVRFPAE